MATLTATVVSTSFLLPKKPILTNGLRSLPKVGQTLFGLKGGERGGRVSCMAVYKVTLQTPDGSKVIECPDGICILEAAEKNGIELPYSCREGFCSSCAGKLMSGGVAQPDQSFLDEEQIKAGWVLNCSAYPTSDVVIATHKSIFNFSFTSFF